MMGSYGLWVKDGVVPLNQKSIVRTSPIPLLCSCCADMYRSSPEWNRDLDRISWVEVMLRRSHAVPSSKSDSILGTKSRYYTTCVCFALLLTAIQEKINKHLKSRPPSSSSGSPYPLMADTMRWARRGLDVQRDSKWHSHSHVQWASSLAGWHMLLLKVCDVGSYFTHFFLPKNVRGIVSALKGLHMWQQTDSLGSSGLLYLSGCSSPTSPISRHLCKHFTAPAAITGSCAQIKRVTRNHGVPLLVYYPSYPSRGSPVWW